MKVSKKWLQEFVFLPDSLSAEELAKELTLRTVEVEGIAYQAQNLDNIVVGLIEKVENHPNADKLKVCHVNIGNESLQIVCGGSNVKEKMKVALAKIGAKVRWHGEGDLIELAPSLIRGLESFGMICGADEIGLAEKFPKTDEKEIVDLSSLPAKPGTLLSKALAFDDVTLEIDNKSLSNRPDLWGQYGMAREIATIYHKNLSVYNPPAISEGKEWSLKVKVENSALCPRYMGVVLDTVKSIDSPDWLQERLLAVGIRPINVLVDVTNYVMMELGQPLHAFDATKIASKDNVTQIFVREARQGETFQTLDGKERMLEEGMLVIADTDHALALAGIMGGKGSEVDSNTTRIILEAANFDGASIRRSSSRLGLRTDASARFEKNLDPHFAELALRKAVELILKLLPDARVVSEVADIFNYTFSVDTLSFPISLFEKKLGASIPEKEIVKILDRLGFAVKQEKKLLTVHVPSWRATKDISLPEDIVEEVLRIYGYENIPATLPLSIIAPPLQNIQKILERKMKNILAFECGFTETYNYSFESPEFLHKMKVDTSLHLELENPIAKDRPLIRRSLIPNMLENLESNLHRYSEVKLFESGRTYKVEEAGERVESNSAELLPRQDVFFSALYAKKGDELPFFALSEVLRILFERLHLTYELRKNDAAMRTNSWSHPGRQAFLVVQNQIVGELAEIHPQISTNLGMTQRVAYLEINLNVLVNTLHEKISYEPLCSYPEIVRDIAIVLDKNITHNAVVESILAIDPLIRQVELFDVYEGEHVPKNKKSMAYHIEYRSSEKTLTMQEVDTVHNKVLKMLEKDFAGKMRS